MIRLTGRERSGALREGGDELRGRVGGDVTRLTVADSDLTGTAEDGEMKHR